MHLISLKLPIIRKNDPLLEIIIKTIKDTHKSLKEGDILVISEKIVAISQGRIVNLSKLDKISSYLLNAFLTGQKIMRDIDFAPSNRSLPTPSRASRLSNNTTSLFFHICFNLLTYSLHFW